MAPKLTKMATIQVEGPDELDVSDLDCEDDFRTAMDAVSEDHGLREYVPAERAWVYELEWNEDIDGIEVGRFGIQDSFRLEDTAADEQTNNE